MTGRKDDNMERIKVRTYNTFCNDFEIYQCRNYYSVLVNHVEYYNFETYVKALEFCLKIESEG